MNSLLIAFVITLLLRFVCLKEGHLFNFKSFLVFAGALLVAVFGIYQSASFAAILSVFMVVLHGILCLSEARLNRSSPALRTITLLAAIPLVYFAFTSGADFNLRWRGLGSFSTEWLALLTASFLCLKESNFAIRWFFRHHKLIEKVEALSDAPSTENGRIIGNLERLLLLLFLWQGAALAATFIVAVKGLARFKKMEEHQAFAE